MSFSQQNTENLSNSAWLYDPIQKSKNYGKTFEFFDNYLHFVDVADRLQDMIKEKELIFQEDRRFSSGKRYGTRTIFVRPPFFSFDRSTMLENKVFCFFVEPLGKIAQSGLPDEGSVVHYNAYVKHLEAFKSSWNQYLENSYGSEDNYQMIDDIANARSRFKELSDFVEENISAGMFRLAEKPQRKPGVYLSLDLKPFYSLLVEEISPREIIRNVYASYTELIKEKVSSGYALDESEKERAELISEGHKTIEKICSIWTNHIEGSKELSRIKSGMILAGDPLSEKCLGFLASLLFR